MIERSKPLDVFEHIRGARRGDDLTTIVDRHMDGWVWSRRDLGTNVETSVAGRTRAPR